MDALEFLKERKRMCHSFGLSCDGCTLDEKTCTSTSNLADKIYKENVKAVEKWSKEHPPKTRQSEFLKMFPNADADAEGVLFISPCRIDKALHGPLCRPGCAGCRRDYWLQEVE